MRFDGFRDEALQAMTHAWGGPAVAARRTGRGDFVRQAAAVCALPLCVLAIPAWAQGIDRGAAVGQLEVKAYRPIPKTKTAVQLNTDTHLARELRRHVMTRLARRGNEVGFSGGNVMRLDVDFSEFSGGRDGGTFGSPPAYDVQGAIPRPAMPDSPLTRRDGGAPPSAGSALRLALTLYEVDSGKVLWTATISCLAQSSTVQRSGEVMIDTIFDDADRSRAGDAGCPL